jgi:alkyl hydroperoxide reductase subunit AhpF
MGRERGCRAARSIPGEARVAILTERDRAAVRDELARLAGPVKLVVFTSQLEASEYALETERLVREVAECSDQVTVELLNLHIDRMPAIVVEGARDYGIRFFGIPMGYEFTNLIDAMVAASSGVPSLGAETLERLAGLRERVHIQVFTTPT